MANANLSVKSLMGLTPGADRRVVGKPFVLDGQNFLFDLQGPYSGFGGEFASVFPFTDPEGFTSFRVEGVVFHCTASGIWRRDVENEAWTPLYLFANNVDGTKPWSMAYVGGVYFFCHESCGVLLYNPSTEAWSVVTSGVPVGAMYVAEAFGRLIIQGSSQVSWSALGVGTDLTPSLTTGAGAQGLSIVAGGMPIAVRRTADGFVTYTTRGILRAVFHSGLNSFTFPSLRGGDFVPLNAFCLVDFSETEHVLLDKRGFFKFNGVQYEPWQGLMGEHLSRFVIPRYDAMVYPLVRMTFFSERKLLFVSFGSGTNDPTLYDYAYVAYLLTDNWGKFSYNHRALTELVSVYGTEANYELGWVDSAGYVRYITGAVSQEILPTSDHFVHNRQESYEPRHQSGTHVFGSICRLTANDVAEVLNPDAAAGFYQLSGAEGVSARTTEALNAEIKVGLFRFNEAQFPDEIGLITNIAVGMNPSQATSENEDWNVLAGAEDWNTLTEGEDYGVNVAVYNIYGLTVIGTNDGSSTFNSCTPALEEETESTNFYTLEVTGIYHVLHFTANEVGQSFHLKSLEVSGTLAGRL